MIHPNVISYQSRPAGLNTSQVFYVYQIPLASDGANIDAGIIEQIRSQPKPNDIINYTSSPYKQDITQAVKLMGAYSSPSSLQKTFNAVTEIHETLNGKAAPEIKSWIHLLTGIHPLIDKKIKVLGYWRMPYSEVIGTNTILYYAGTDSIDITNWAETPKFGTNEVVWFLTPWESPHYIRESIRQKLDSSVVEMIQNAGHTTTKFLRRNLIWESMISTDAGSGAEASQKRPIAPDNAHGLSLNNDWYHQSYRIMDGYNEAKNYGRQDAIQHLQSGGYDVYKLVNHLTPLINNSKAMDRSTRFQFPLGVEETFPNRPSNISVDVDNAGQKVIRSTSVVNNNVLKPEVIQYE